MKCMLNLSTYVYYVWGRYNEALDKFQYLLKYYDDINDRSNQSRVLNTIGNIYDDNGEYDAALDKHNESLEISRQLGDKNIMARSLNNYSSNLSY